MGFGHDIHHMSADLELKLRFLTPMTPSPVNKNGKEVVWWEEGGTEEKKSLSLFVYCFGSSVLPSDLGLTHFPNPLICRLI